MSDIKELLIVLGAFFGVLLVLGIGIGTAGYYIEKSTCHSFGRQANREVKFVMYNLISWDCLTPTQDGKWISTNRLRDID